AWGGPPTHKGDGDFYWWVWMYGATKQPAEKLVPVARGWLKAPRISGKNFTGRYDLTQRCYVVSPEDPGRTQSLRFSLEASPENPILNPAFVVENWGKRGVSARLDGREIRRGKDYRIGYVRRINRYDLVLWMELQSTSPASIELR
ncbi:MAG: hypothetical protein AB1715_03750, partial [Acidobacteriota bacterium]